MTQKPAALLRFFLIAPELTRLSEQVLQMAGISTSQRTKHHEISRSTINRQEQNIQKMKSVMLTCNPFTQEDGTLKNFVTNAVMPENVQKDILRSTSVGQDSYNKFVEDRIVGPKNLWDKMNKVKRLTWTDAAKPVKIVIPSKVIELKQTRSLFSRLLIVARTRDELDLEDLIGRDELSCLPRSIFSSDGSLLPCTDKSKLMALLESLPTSETPAEVNPESEPTPSEDLNGQAEVTHSSMDTSKVEIRNVEMDMVQAEVTADQLNTVSYGNESVTAIVIDGMALVHELSSQHITTCIGIADAFVKSVVSKAKGYTLVHVVFDRYNIKQSLKAKIRNRRQGKMSNC